MSQEHLLGALSGAHGNLLPVRALHRHLAKRSIAVQSTRASLWVGIERTRVAVIVIT